jgi:tRNA(Arg) A34 adenosine deaminase TadA
LKRKRKPWDEDRIRKAIEIASNARENGNHPFGALLTDQKGQILLKAENTVITERDCTGHAETNLMRMACKNYDHDYLANCIVYTSTEPCPMCVGAIFWANVRRVVYGLSEKKLYEIIGDSSEEALEYSSKEIFGRGNKKIEVIGPLLETEALKVHENFWN